MNSIAFKGTDTIATILSHFGKIKTNGTKSFSITITDLESTLTSVKVSAIATKADKESALAALTPNEQATLAKLQAKVDKLAKESAEKRVQGQTSERWSTKGNISLG